MNDERIELRAERLRVLVAAIGEEPTMDVHDTFDLGLIPGGWDDCLSDAEWGLDPGSLEDDIDLAYECANVARSIRSGQWSALERADALVAAGDGGPLPVEAQEVLARSIIQLGWHNLPEEK